MEGKTAFRNHYRTGVYSRSLTQDLRWHKEVIWSRNASAGKKLLYLTGRTLGTLLRAGTFRGTRRFVGCRRSRPIRRRAHSTSRNLYEEEAATDQGCHNSAVAGYAAPATIPLEPIVAGESPQSLFVCKGNICRSPFAEQLAHERWPAGVSVSSAGYYPRAGRPAPDLARRAANDWGVDLTPHRSRLVTADMMRAAEIIFVFDEANYAHLVQEFAFAKERIHYLGAAGRSSSVTIADPYGKDLRTFRAVYTQIAEAITSVSSLFGSPDAHIAVK